MEGGRVSVMAGIETIEPSCQLKVRHDSRKLAAAAAALMRGTTGEYVMPYHCRRHHCWHIGHPNPRDKGNPTEPLKETE